MVVVVSLMSKSFFFFCLSLVTLLLHKSSDVHIEINRIKGFLVITNLQAIPIVQIPMVCVLSADIMTPPRAMRRHQTIILALLRLDDLPWDSQWCPERDQFDGGSIGIVGDAGIVRGVGVEDILTVVCRQVGVGWCV